MSEENKSKVENIVRDLLLDYQFADVDVFGKMGEPRFQDKSQEMHFNSGTNLKLITQQVQLSIVFHRHRQRVTCTQRSGSWSCNGDENPKGDGQFEFVLTINTQKVVD
jgi:hypothetical protein